MNDIKLARGQFDCRDVIGDALGGRRRDDMYSCPFHEDSTPSFKVYKDGYNCFGCGEHGDIFDWFSFWQKRPLKDVLIEQNIDPMAEAVRKQEYLAREAADIRERLERLEENIKSLQEEQLHLQYYERGGELGKEAWEARGIPGWYQDFTYLGFDPDHKFWIGRDYHSPTLTIPVYQPGTRDVTSIRHRLLNPDSEVGKYRPERSGLPLTLYAANPDEAIGGATVLVEGEIKAMVTWITADGSLSVLGSPGNGLSKEMIASLKDCDPIYLVPDPDKFEDVPDVTKKLGAERVRVVYLPDKIDDYILRFNLGQEWLRNVLRSARRVTA